MKFVKYSVLLAAALALAGCSSVKTQVDTGAIAAHTFSFVNTGPKTPPAATDNRTLVHQMVQQALVKTLAGKGVTFVNTGGDLTVAYLVIAGNNVTTTSLNDYFGYGADATALVEKIHSEQAVKNSNRNYFEEGTLVIDLVDSKTGKVLKRATVQSPILRNLPADTRQARIQGFVDQALGDVRIAK
jgi:PBP1b-binding outer membrane lipoprotein LpoB